MPRETADVPAGPAVEELSLREGRGRALLGTLTAAHFSHHVTELAAESAAPIDPRRVRPQLRAERYRGVGVRAFGGSGERAVGRARRPHRVADGDRPRPPPDGRRQRRARHRRRVLAPARVPRADGHRVRLVPRAGRRAHRADVLTESARRGHGDAHHRRALLVLRGARARGLPGLRERHLAHAVSRLRGRADRVRRAPLVRRPARAGADRTRATASPPSARSRTCSARWARSCRCRSSSSSDSRRSSRSWRCTSWTCAASRPPIAALLFGVPQLVGIVGSPAGGWLSDHLGRRTVILGALTLLGPTIFAITVVPNEALVLVLVLFGLLWAMRSTVTETLVMDSAPPGRRATVLGAFYLVERRDRRAGRAALRRARAGRRARDGVRVDRCRVRAALGRRAGGRPPPLGEIDSSRAPRRGWLQRPTSTVIA